MAEGEKSSLGCSAKKQTKYGSTRKETRVNEYYTTHIVSKDDTLHGIAIKYGLTLERLKRANKLWTNDSLFLRDTLQIPVLADNPSTSTAVNGLEPCDTNIAIIQTNPSATQTDNNNITSVDNGASRSASTNDILVTLIAPETSANDFLSKFDSSLETLKSSVKKQGERLSTLDGAESNPLAWLPQKKSKFGSRHHLKSIESDEDLSTNPELSFYPKAKGTSGGATSFAKSKQIHRKSMEDMERKQDELFQL